jgi:hypothetical protein
MSAFRSSLNAKAMAVLEFLENASGFPKPQQPFGVILAPEHWDPKT